MTAPPGTAGGSRWPGVSGAGTTIPADRVAAVIGARPVEIDSLLHGPDRTPRESLVADVDEFTSGPGIRMS